VPLLSPSIIPNIFQARLVPLDLVAKAASQSLAVTHRGGGHNVRLGQAPCFGPFLLKRRKWLKAPDPPDGDR